MHSTAISWKIYLVSRAPDHDDTCRMCTVSNVFPFRAPPTWATDNVVDAVCSAFAGRTETTARVHGISIRNGRLRVGDFTVRIDTV